MFWRGRAWSVPLTAWICAATLVACGPEPEPQAGYDALSAFGVELVDGGSRVAGLSWGGPGDAGRGRDRVRRP